MDTQEIEFSRKLEKEKSLLNIMMLVPHKRYLVSIKVQSAGVTSEVVEDSTITMIDRKCPSKVFMGPPVTQGRGLCPSLGHFHPFHSTAPMCTALEKRSKWPQENRDLSLSKVLH